jgi:heavy metal sensor kinase
MPMNRVKTLRVRLAIWTASLLLIALSFFGAFVYLSMRQGLASSIDASLRMSATQAIAAVNIENGQINLTDSLPETSPASDLQERGLTIRVFSPTGQALQSVGAYRNLPIDMASVQNARAGTTSFSTALSSGADPVRVYTLPMLDDSQHLLGVVQVMQSLAPVQETLKRLLVVLLLSIPLLVVASAFSGYYLAGRALTPIDQITRTAQRISAEDLSARLNLRKTDDEVGRLAATFDRMLSRLEDAFRRERQFTADASHELRTPLAAIQAIVSVTREKRRSPAEYEKALDDIAEETDRLRALTGDLLQIARGDAHQANCFATVNLSDLLGDVGASLQPLAEAKKLALRWQIEPGLLLRGDSDALIRVFLNLVDNAVKYTARGEITIQALRKGERSIEVRVSDTGRGIPPEHLPHIFRRFYRVEPARSTRGAGLGLAIVQGIVQAHHGSIEVVSQVGVGTTFGLRFLALEPNSLEG